MLSMKEPKLTEKQKKKIKELKEQWMDEVESLPEIKLPPNTLSHASNKPRMEIEKKYQELIQKVIDGEM